jgi:tripartite-type tricarboxylate transporter receptor subunit TctC
MRHMKRIAAICIFGMLVLGAHLALAQTAFPSRVVKIIVPFPGGGINDVLARILADNLQIRWGQPVVIENKTGAGGNIGADLAYQSEPDGHTLLLSPPGPLAINQSLYKQLSYRPQDFIPLTVDGRVKIVALADGRRSPALPEVPTTAEVGLPGLLSTGWFALVAPPKTSPTLQSAIADAAIAAIKMPDVQEKFRAASVEPAGSTPAAAAAFINEEAQRWSTVIKNNNITVD